MKQTQTPDSPRLRHCAAASLLAFSAALAAPGATQAAAPATMARLPATAADSQAFEAEVDAFLKAYWQMSPDAAVASGQYAAAARLPAPTEARRLALIGFCEQWRARLSKLAGKLRLTAGQTGDLALLENHLKAQVWAMTALRADQWNPSEYNVAEPFSELLNKDFAPLPQRLALIDRRLQQVPAYYRAALAQIRAPSPAHLQLAISQNEGGLALLRDDIPKAMAAAAASGAAGLSPAKSAAMHKHQQQAVRALESFIAALKQIDARQTAEGSGRSFRLGRALFEDKFRFEIQASVDAPTLYQRALEQKQALHQRMAELAAQLWPGLFPDQPRPDDRLLMVARVIDKLSERHVSREGYIDEIKAQIPALAAWVEAHDLLTLDPSRPLLVRETPSYMRGVAGASISAPGPLDAKGVTYYNVDPLDAQTAAWTESYLREYNHWVLQILSIHEAIPGHYVQLLHSNKSPSKVKALFGNGAMVEGWAVYAERMMMESGWGNVDGQPSPEMGLMYAKWNLRVVCNAILDYQTHVLGLGEAEAEQLLEREAFQSHTEASEKWHRAQVSAVQLSSYFAGFSEILALREEMKALQGERFRLKAFHEEFLSHGSAPVAMVSRLMRAAAK